MNKYTANLDLTFVAVNDKFTYISNLEDKINRYVENKFHVTVLDSTNEDDDDEWYTYRRTLHVTSPNIIKESEGDDDDFADAMNVDSVFYVFYDVKEKPTPFGVLWEEWSYVSKSRKSNRHVPWQRGIL